MKSKTKEPSITLRDLWSLANEWVPRKACWKHLLDYWNNWGPAHELGHALLEPAERRSKRSYGRCAPGACQHEDDECGVAEIAAMMISAQLVTAAGHPALAEREVQGTTDYDVIATPANYRRARKLLKQRKLWLLPRTKATLERALRARLGRRVPVAQRKKRAKRFPWSPVSLFANMLFNLGGS
jgi:hypothetical protein